MKKTKKQKFSIIDFLASRPLSWSALSSFEYDPEQWYQSYIVGVRQQSKEMDFGSWVDKKIQEDPTFLPTLPRYPVMQQKFVVRYADIPLVGLLDGYSKDPHKIWDYKTGKKAWDQERADETGQLTFYALLNFITNRVKPEETEFGIHWMPTKDNGDFTVGFVDDIENNIKSIATKRSMVDLLKFGQRIRKTVNAMEKYVNSKG